MPKGAGRTSIPIRPIRGSVIGFEVELADALAEELGVKAQFFQGAWDDLPALLRDARRST